MRIIEGASIFNIDFAAGLFSGIYNSDEGIWVFLNNNPPISNNKQYYKYISRLAIPTLDWDYCTDDIWRLRFIPTISSSREILEPLLIQQLEKFGRQFKEDDFENKEEFDKRFRNIINILRAEENLIDFYKTLIAEIYKKVLSKSEIPVNLLGGYLEMNSTEYNSSDFIFQQIFEHLKNKKAGNYKLVKGGKLIFDFENEKIICTKIIKQEYSFIFVDKDDDYKNIELKFVAIIKNEIPKFNLKCEGPIQMLHLQHFGVLCHLPWYMPATKTENNFKCLEFISPISNSYSERTSSYMGGLGLRLNPSGYSLLDYKNNKVLRLISYLLKIEKIEWADLNDWQFLIENYPLTKEKLAEHQGEVNKFIDLRVKEELKDMIKKGFTDEVKQLFGNSLEINFLTVGQYLIKAVALLKYLKNLMIDNNGIELNLGQIDFLKTLGNNSKFELSSIIKNIQKMVEILGVKLVDLGYNYDRWSILNEKINNLILEALKTNHIPISENSLEIYLQNKNFGKLSHTLKSAIFEYYCFVSFFTSTVLKANIYTSYLLFGGAEYSAEIRKILKKRKTSKTFKYIPVYFEEIFSKK